MRSLEQALCVDRSEEAKRARIWSNFHLVIGRGGVKTLRNKPVTSIRVRVIMSYILATWAAGCIFIVLQSDHSLVASEPPPLRVIKF